MTTKYTIAAINEMDRFYRANLVNGVSGLRSAHIVGTVNEDGLANAAIFSNVVHLGAQPALIAFVQRPIMETSHTFKNIISNSQFTINHVPAAMINNAHQTSAKYEDGISEFDACGFTAEYINGFAAPFVKASEIKMGLSLVETIPIKHNNTTLIIGAVEHLIINNELILPDGNIDLAKANAVVAGGLERYYTVDFLAQFPYAKL